MIEIPWNIIFPVLKGAGAGIVMGLVGYFKTHPKIDLEHFDYKKMLPVVLISAIVGGYAMFKGLTYNTTYDMMIAGGLGVVVDMFCKAIYRVYKKLKN